MKKSSRTKNSIMNFITSMGGQVLSTILGFATRTVFIYVLGKQYLGINGLFSDILQMLSLAELGIDTAINYKLYKPLAQNDIKRVRVLMKFYKQAYCVIGLIILALGLCLIPFLPTLIKDYDSLEVLGINAVLVFLIYLLQSVSSYLFFAYRSAIIKAKQKEYILNIADYAIAILSSLSQMAILLIWKNFILYTASMIFFNILKNMVNAIIAQRFYPEVFQKEDDRLGMDEVKGLLKDCGALFVYKVNGVVLKATDNLVLSTFIGLTVVGMYSNYLLFYTTIKKFLNRFYRSTTASMGDFYATSKVEEGYAFFEIMNYITIILYGTAAVGIAVTVNEVICCWIGNSYVIPQPFPILMGIEVLFVGLKYNLGQIRNVTGVFRQMWYRPAIGAAINLIVSVILVQKIGIFGVILGTIISDLLTNFLLDPSVIHKYSFKDYKPVSVYYKKNLKYILILFAVGAVDYYLCSVIITQYDWISLIIHIGICAVSVPSVFLLLYRKNPECKYLLKKMNSLLKKFRR